MRSDYDFLTDATKRGLTDRVKRAAAGWGKSLETIYQILRGEKQDPYAYFRSFYEGMCEGGVPTDAWDSDMALLRQQYGRDGAAPCTQDAFKEKFHGHSRLFESYLAAVSDGHIDAEETEQLLSLIAIEKPLLEALDKALIAHKAKLCSGGQLSVVSGQPR